jgi:uncharacterized protein YnzC (UPF0291/DUF896 family)
MKKKLGRDFQKKLSNGENWVNVEMEEREKEDAFTEQEKKELVADILREAYLEKVKAILHKAIWEG